MMYMEGVVEWFWNIWLWFIWVGLFGICLCIELGCWLLVLCFCGFLRFYEFDLICGFLWWGEFMFELYLLGFVGRFNVFLFLVNCVWWDFKKDGLFIRLFDLCFWFLCWYFWGLVEVFGDWMLLRLLFCY